MIINEISTYLDFVAHPSLQEAYDNAGLITGKPEWECTGIVCSLDATEEVVMEAITKRCNLVVAHHPIIFSGLKKINGKNYVEKAIITALKNDIAIYATHTNLDNVSGGVSWKMAKMIGLKNCSVLLPKVNTLKKLFTFVPADNADQVRNAIFLAGGGSIGNYHECSFNTEGTGTFNAGDEANPYVGIIGQRHSEKEVKIEVVIPAWLENKVVMAMKEVHPYEEVAYDIVPLANNHPQTGSGVVGELDQPFDELSFLNYLKSVFQLKVIRHTRLKGRVIKRVALCGGAGSFLIPNALSHSADIFITADLKYHEFFDANERMVIADIGHYESEQFTINLLQEILEQKFPNFAVLKTEINTNPVYYF